MQIIVNILWLTTRAQIPTQEQHALQHLREEVPDEGRLKRTSVVCRLQSDCVSKRLSLDPGHGEVAELLVVVDHLRYAFVVAEVAQKDDFFLQEEECIVGLGDLDCHGVFATVKGSVS